MNLWDDFIDEKPQDFERATYGLHLIISSIYRRLLLQLREDGGHEQEVRRGKGEIHIVKLVLRVAPRERIICWYVVRTTYNS